MPLREIAKRIMDIVGSAPTASAKQAHLDWTMGKLKEAEVKFSNLESENLSLLRENRELQNKIKELEKSDEFLDLGCCALKKKTNGGYFDTPHCPQCYKLFSKMDNIYACAPCKLAIPIKDIVEAIKRS